MHVIQSHQGTSQEEQAAGVLASDDKSPCKVDEGLYLGSMLAALNNAALSDLGVTHVINCAKGLAKNWPKFKPTYAAQYLQLEWDDTADMDIVEGVDIALHFIRECRSKGGICFVHWYVKIVLCMVINSP